METVDVILGAGIISIALGLIKIIEGMIPKLKKSNGHFTEVDRNRLKEIHFDRQKLNDILSELKVHTAFFENFFKRGD